MSTVSCHTFQQIPFPDDFKEYIKTSFSSLLDISNNGNLLTFRFSSTVNADSVQSAVTNYISPSSYSTLTKTVCMTINSDYSNGPVYSLVGTFVLNEETDIPKKMDIITSGNGPFSPYSIRLYDLTNNTILGELTNISTIGIITMPGISNVTSEPSILEFQIATTSTKFSVKIYSILLYYYNTVTI